MAMSVPTGALDITLYRDDLMPPGGPQPLVRRTEIPFSIDAGKSARRRRALYGTHDPRGADALIDFGRPQVVQLSCRRSRHRELRSRPTT
jgi:pyrimidine operon attenuation protein/uracil phosphoribosyltransferase